VGVVGLSGVVARLLRRDEAGGGAGASAPAESLPGNETREAP